MGWLRVCGLMVVLLAGANSASAYTGKKLALLVGCEKYVHAHLTDLDYAEEDVLELAEVLKAQGFVCKVLTHQTGAKDPDLEPTAGNIRKTLTKLLTDVSKNDLFLVGLAGHGMQPLGYDEPFFCPMDANPVTKDKTPDSTVAQVFVKPETVVGIGTMLAEIDASGVGQKLVIVDACRNAPLLRGRNASFTFKAMPQQTGLILSCSSGQFANESKLHKHGIFFHAVLEGLRGEAADKKGLVTIDDLAAYAKRRTREIATEMEAKQQPQTVLNLDGEPIVLARVVAKPNVPAPEPVVKAEPLAWPFSESEAKRGQAEWAKSLGQPVVEKNLAGMEMVLIPPGTFTMGSPEGEKDRSADENQVEVTLTKAFRLAKTEVTVGQFRRFVTARGYKTEAESDGKGGYGFNQTSKEFEQNPEYTWKNPGFSQTDSHPVVNVSWNDAQKYCEWLSGEEQKAYRLPTEAEWEWCCRAGTRIAFASGDDPEGLAFVGNVSDGTAKEKFSSWTTISAKDGFVFTAPVGQYRANGFGLSDLHGNVWEWCGDVYVDKLRGGRDPEVNEGGVGDRVNRGGSWYSTPAICRSAYRVGNSPDDRSNDLGFRPLAVQSHR